jgi:hypothetical protein
LLALAADEGEVLVSAGLLEDERGEFLFRGGEFFFAGGNALGVEKPLLDQLCATGLDGEIGLGEGDFLLARIAILGDEIAGIAGEHEIVNFTLRALAELDHFVDVNKMIGNHVARDFAGDFRLGDGSLVEVAPLGIAEKLLEIASQPVFDAALGLLGVAFESLGELMNEVGFHRYPEDQVS